MIGLTLVQQLHLQYVTAAAILRARVYGISPNTNPDYIRKIAASVDVAPFVPKSGVKIQVNENEPLPAAISSEEEEKNIICTLPKPDTVKVQLNPVEFEKDDDTNYHIAFITAASNLRASNYSIKNASLHETKGIAGRITPAIATTTALVTGLVNLELLKYIDGKGNLEKYKNAYLNLALPMFNFSEPVPCSKRKVAISCFVLLGS